MDTANLQIKVGADLTDLKRELLAGRISVEDFAQKSGTAFTAAGKSIQTFGLTGQQYITQYNQNLANLRTAAAQSSEGVSTSLASIGAGATKALGFVRQLAYIIPGVGVAGLLGFAAEPLIKYAQSLFDISDAAKQTAKDVADVTKQTAGIFSTAGKEEAQVLSLIAVLKSETETRYRKLEALQALQKINPDIFNGLKLEEGAVSGLDAAYKNYIANLKTVLAAKIVQAQIEQKTTELLKAEGATQSQLVQGLLATGRAMNSSITQGRALQKVLDDTKSDKVQALNTEIEGLFKTLQQFSAGVKLDPINDEKAKKSGQTVSDVLSKLREQIALLNKEEVLFNTDKSKERVSAFLSAISTLTTRFKLDPDGKLIAGLFDEAKIASQGFVLKSGLLKLGVAASKYFKEGFDTQLRLEPLTITFDVKPIEKNSALPGLNNIGLNTKGIGEFLNNIPNSADAEKSKEVAFLLANNITTGIQDGLRVGVKGLRMPELSDLYKSTEQRLAEFQKGINQIISSTFQDIAISIGETIGKTLASGKQLTFKNLFEGLEGSLGKGLEQLGEYLIKTYLLVELLQKIKFSNPILGVAAGVALVALGAAIQSRVQKTPGFAQGVTGFSGGLALVGERGPELVNLPQGSDVIPNHALGSFGGQSQQVPYILSTEVSGQNLRLVLARADQSYSRNT